MPNKPMIELEQTPDSKKGGVPVLSYNVPDPTSYTGKNFIELDFIPKKIQSITLNRTASS